MSAHLFDNFPLFRRSSSDDPASAIDPETSRVRRALFGPPDHEENRRFVERELARNRKEASEKWNYDFENDKPQPGRYEWESARQIHAAYGCARLPYISDHTAEVETKNADSDSKGSDDPASSTPLDSTNKSVLSAGAKDDSANAKIPSDAACDKSASGPSSSHQRSLHQSAITGFMQPRKRSKSKVKTQERKSKSEQDQTSLSDSETQQTVSSS